MTHLESRPALEPDRRPSELFEADPSSVRDLGEVGGVAGAKS